MSEIKNEDCANDDAWTKLWLRKLKSYIDERVKAVVNEAFKCLIEVLPMPEAPCRDEEVTQPCPDGCIEIDITTEPTDDPEPGPYKPKDKVAVWIDVRNCGESILTCVEVASAVLPEPVTVGVINPGQTVSLVAHVLVTEEQARAESFEISATATAIYKSTNEPVEVNTTAVVETFMPEAELGIAKRLVDPGPFAEGDNATFSIVVSNDGTDVIYGLTVNSDAELSELNVDMLDVGDAIEIQATTTVTAEQAAAESFDCDTVARGSGVCSAENVSASVAISVPTRSTITKCGKVITPVVNLSDGVAYESFNDGDTQMTWDVGNGITFEATWPQGFSTDFPRVDGAPMKNFNSTDSLNAAGELSVAGLDALKLNDCQAMMTVGYAADSILLAGISVSHDANTNVTDTSFTGNVDQSGNVYTHSTGDEGEVDFIAERMVDGVIATFGYESGDREHGPRQALRSVQVQIPVEITCFEDTGEFVSAVDANGTSYAESVVEAV